MIAGVVIGPVLWRGSGPETRLIFQPLGLVFRTWGAHAGWHTRINLLRHHGPSFGDLADSGPAHFLVCFLDSVGSISDPLWLGFSALPPPLVGGRHVLSDFSMAHHRSLLRLCGLGFQTRYGLDFWPSRGEALIDVSVAHHRLFLSYVFRSIFSI